MRKRSRGLAMEAPQRERLVRRWSWMVWMRLSRGVPERRDGVKEPAVAIELLLPGGGEEGWPGGGGFGYYGVPHKAQRVGGVGKR